MSRLQSRIRSARRIIRSLPRCRITTCTTRKLLPLPTTWNDHPREFLKSFSAGMGASYGEAGFREYLRCYYARVTMMDACIGRILDTIDQLGLRDRTLIVFTSDHGNMLGQHGMMEKSTEALYDDLMRVPLLMRLPGQIRAGTICDASASSVERARDHSRLPGGSEAGQGPRPQLAAIS